MTEQTTEIIFYEEKIRPEPHCTDLEPSYNKYSIKDGTSSKYGSLGCWGDIIVVALSNGKIVITNDLIMREHVKYIPKGALIGTIYGKEKRKVECYIYSDKERGIKPRIKNAQINFNTERGWYLHEE
mgnify:CR=1 FL=1|jgi:hypothetical protein